MSKSTKVAAKKKKAPPPEEGLELMLEDQIKCFQSQNQALQLQLAQRTEQISNAQTQIQKLSQDVMKAKLKYDSAQELRESVDRDMTRQYKGMEDSYLRKINARERTIAELRDAMEANHCKTEREIQNRDDVIAKMGNEIASWKLKLEEVALDFSNMLSEAHRALQDNLEGRCVNSVALRTNRKTGRDREPTTGRTLRCDKDGDGNDDMGTVDVVNTKSIREKMDDIFKTGGGLAIAESC